MPAHNSFTTKALISYSQAAVAPSAVTASIMHSTRILRTSGSRSTSAMTGVAKAITSFLFGEAHLPDFLSHYAGFFTGFVTGALGGSALYAYVHRNKCDRAKVKLAVYHILHVIQHRPDYTALLHDPQELLKHIDSEVMRLVDLHLTQNEAGQVIKEVKRNYDHIASEKHVHKRFRESKRDPVKERMGPHLTPAYTPSPRGFLPSPATEQPYIDYKSASKPNFIFNIKSRLSLGTPDVSSCDSSVRPDTPFARDLLTSDQKQARFELGQIDDCMEIEKAVSSISIPHVPSHLFSSSPCPSIRRSAAPSPESSIFVGRVITSTPALPEQNDCENSELNFTRSPESAEHDEPVAESLHKSGKAKRKKGAKTAKSPHRHAPESGSFGLDYDDSDIYSSSPSSDDEDLQARGPPTVVRKLQGVKCSSTTLSPIQGSPFTTEALQASDPPVQTIPQAAAEPANVLPFAHWSTQPDMTYSSSESDDGEEPAVFVSMFTQPEVTYSSSYHESEDQAPTSHVAITVTSRSPSTSPEPSVAANPVQEDGVCKTVEEAERPQISEPEAEQENLPPSRPSRKRKSPSSSPPPSPKRVRSSPLADITNGPTSPERKSKMLSPRASASPPRTPFKSGRGRGRTGSGPAVPAIPAAMETPKAKTTKKPAKTPGTRKSSRLENKVKRNE